MQRKPWGLKWRSYVWFTTLVVGFGIATDMLVYSAVIPVFPFQLERLGYSRVSSLVGWLLFAYSGGLVLSTIPIAMLSENYASRRTPLITGLVTLLASQIMLMESPAYWLMCLARVLQGISSSVVWVVGLALLADTVPEKKIGRQLGFSMMGLSIGLVVGPPVGGALYSNIGFRAPFIFGEICTAVDLLGRLLIIEHKDAVSWNADLAAVPEAYDSQPDLTHEDDMFDETTENTPLLRPSGPPYTDVTSIKSLDDHDEALSSASSTVHATSSEDVSACCQPLSLAAVVLKLAKSPRALVALIITFSYGVTYTSQEPALPIHMQDLYGFDSWKVGLVFLAAVVPAIFSGPLSGLLADNKGTEWAVTLFIGCAVPWWIVIAIRLPVGLFVTAFAIESFFSSGLHSLLTTELAAVARNEDIGYAHTYGAFTLAYGVGNAVGPVIGGQLYDLVKQGWMVLCLFSAGLLTVCLCLAFAFVGVDPLLSRLRRSIRARR